MSFESAQRAYDMQTDDSGIEEEEWIEEEEEQPSQREIDDVFKLWEGMKK